MLHLPYSEIPRKYAPNFHNLFFTITKINLLKPFRLQLHAKLHKVGEIFKRVGEIASVSYLLKFESFLNIY